MKVFVSNDPSNYGLDLDDVDRAARRAANVVSKIRREFPGVRVAVYSGECPIHIEGASAPSSTKLGLTILNWTDARWDQLSKGGV
jgi:hypothetical protein